MNRPDGSGALTGPTLPLLTASLAAGRLLRHDRSVPRISQFYGIVIEMYFSDHPPPHFHARYSGDEALIVIETGEVFAGALSARGLRLVREWLESHRAELMANWDLARAGEPTIPVTPLP